MESAPPDRAAAARLADRLGVQFADPHLLATALRHPSVSREEDTDRLSSNERLEFLGDAVIELAISSWLFQQHPEWDEGQLTVARAEIVRGRCLAVAADRLDLAGALHLGHEARQVGRRGLISILACGLEAVFGAVYLDQGWDTARACVLRVLEPQLSAGPSAAHRNYKGELQELTQSRWRALPEYRLRSQTGPANQREFVVEVKLGDRRLGQGSGRSKKDAEQSAARLALEVLGASEPPATLPDEGGSKQGDGNR